MELLIDGSIFRLWDEILRDCMTVSVFIPHIAASSASTLLLQSKADKESDGLTETFAVDYVTTF